MRRRKGHVEPDIRATSSIHDQSLTLSLFLTSSSFLFLALY